MSRLLEMESFLWREAKRIASELEEQCEVYGAGQPEMMQRVVGVIHRSLADVGAQAYDAAQPAQNPTQEAAEGGVRVSGGGGIGGGGG